MDARQTARLSQPWQFPIDQGQIRSNNAGLCQQRLTVRGLADDLQALGCCANSTRNAKLTRSWSSAIKIRMFAPAAWVGDTWRSSRGCAFGTAARK